MRGPLERPQTESRSGEVSLPAQGRSRSGGEAPPLDRHRRGCNGARRRRRGRRIPHASRKRAADRPRRTRRSGVVHASPDRRGGEARGSPGRVRASRHRHQDHGVRHSIPHPPERYTYARTAGRGDPGDRISEQRDRLGPYAIYRLLREGARGIQTAERSGRAGAGNVSRQHGATSPALRRLRFGDRQNSYGEPLSRTRIRGVGRSAAQSGDDVGRGSCGKLAARPLADAPTLTHPDPYAEARSHRRSLPHHRRDRQHHQVRQQPHVP